MNAFTEDLNESQILEKLIYCEIKKFCLTFIILKNAWGLVFFDLFLILNVRGQNVKKGSSYTNKIIVFIISKKMGVIL